MPISPNETNKSKRDTVARVHTNGFIHRPNACCYEHVLNAMGGGRESAGAFLRMEMASKCHVHLPRQTLAAWPLPPLAPFLPTTLRGNAQARAQVRAIKGREGEQGNERRDSRRAPQTAGSAHKEG